MSTRPQQRLGIRRLGRDRNPVEATLGPPVGETLQAARERKGVDLYRAERDTKIRLRYLSALEDGDYAELPAYCKGFEVALNPFRINELTLNANPLKVREYMAAGLPVISTPIPEVEVLGQCRIADGAEAFVREIRAALADPGPTVARSQAIRHESWEARLDEIREHLQAITPELNG